MENGLFCLFAATETVEINYVLGFTLLLLGAACGGSFGLPSKFVKKELAWEILWGPFFFFATILLPVVFGPLLVNGLFEIYQTVGWYGIALPLLFGLLWGFGSMTLGLSFAFIGLSLAYAINYGGQIIVGGIGVMLVNDPNTVATLQGAVIIAGVATCLLGVVICGRAGVLKNRAQEGDTATKEGSLKKNIILGLLLACASGALCACWSIGFELGKEDIIATASNETFANLTWRTSIPVTILILWGGSVSSCLYCLHKLFKNNSWGQFRSSGAVVAVILALCMAFLHDGAVLLFGLGATLLGPLGVAIGYAVFMSFAIIVGNFNGFITGEWKGAGSRSVSMILVGILALIIGVCILGKGNAMNNAAKAKAIKEAGEKPAAVTPVEPAPD